MTSEEWIANIPSEQDRKYAREAVNAAIEKEREGEILVTYYEQFVNLPRHKDGQLKGRLTFRPDTKEKI